MVDPQRGLGTLLWSGEHWLLHLRPEGAEADRGRVSLYRAHYSPVGEGTVAFIDIPGEAGFRGTCTDRPELARFITNHMLRGRRSPFDGELPLVEATFSREGSTHTAPVWVISAGKAQIRATWQHLEPPLVGPPTINPRIVFTIVCFANAASLHVNGVQVEGKPYLRDIWQASLGAPRSSCMFALAETMVQ